MRKCNKILLLIILGLIFTSLLVFPDSVPAEFKKLYSHFNKLLSRYIREIDAGFDGGKYDSFLPCASLLAANSNIASETFLNPKYISFVKLYIDRLAELGCKAVQLDIQFPLFDDEYYKFAKEKGLLAASFPEAGDFIEFYKTVAGYIRGKNLVLCVESQVVFTQATWSSLPVSAYYQYFEENREEGFRLYKERKLKMLKIIIRELRPDFLTFSDEPDTEMWLTGITLLNSKENYLDMITGYVNELLPEKNRTKLGTGYGIWDKNWEYWNKKYAELNVDFINIHLYTLDIFPSREDENIIPRLFKAIDTNHSHNKKTVIGETWLYKRLDTDTNDPEIIYGRDYFDFFEELDIKFIELMIKIAHYKKLEYVSFFWSGFFFSYLPYDDAKNLNTAERKKMNNQKVAQNIVKGAFSGTGNIFKELAGR